MRNIVFIHGHSGSKNSFIYLQKHFPKSKAYDLIGFGAEEKPNIDYTTEVFLEFLRKKIDEPSVLVGHSMGAVLVKEFAIKYPELVEKAFLISYPLQDSPEKLRNILNKNLMNRIFLKNTWVSHLMCAFYRRVFKYVYLPLAYLFWRRYYCCVQDYFSHTYRSESQSLKNVILKDDYRTLNTIKDKALLIAGENDEFIDKDLLVQFPHVVIQGMGHNLFFHEDEITEVIKNHL